MINCPIFCSNVIFRKVSATQSILQPRNYKFLKGNTAYFVETKEKAIENLMHDKTVFVIAHRLSTIRNATKIIVVNNGEIVESGTHDELLSLQNGAYKTLYEMQFKGKK